MGIQGLIPFLEKTSRPISISEFSGCTVAIDAYCWLHKGAFSCAEKLARGEKCDAYVYYCMKYINMLLSHNIKPIMVFDGQHLPAKADTEKKRRENREVNRRRAAELLRQDKPNEARTYIRRCVDITHGMALELMHACRAINVDCVTAPYEADAQLAYLNLTGIAHVVITEDSDLILFGCKKVVFKLDPNGGGLLVEQEKLHLSMKSRPENYSFEKFRRMCILSGCDYLPSLPGIGLTKACRFITRTMDPEIERALTRMSSYLNMPQLVVTKEYIKNFVHAEAMFKHQPVFDPIERKLVPLTPIEDTTPQLRLPEPLPQDQAYQLALGNLDPFSLKVVSDWDPDDRQNAKPKWGTSKQASHRSIWAANFEITEPKFRPVKARLPRSTAGKQTIQDPKIELETSNFIDDKDIENMLFDCDENMEISTQPFKKVCLSNEKETESKNEMEVVEEGDNRKSPILSTKMDAKSKLVNKFKKQRNTVLDEKVTVQSRYFNSSPSSANTSTNSPSKLAVNPISDTSGSNSDKETLKDISNVLNETVNKDDEAVRKTSPKKSDDSKVAAEIMMTVQNSPTRKYSENSFSPGKRSSKIVTIRNSLLTELSLEEDKGKDNDSGVSCPNSFELDVVEECSQSSARNGSSISAFTWKQKFHEKFGFKNNSVAEKVLQSSKAVDSGFQSPSSCRNEPESSNRLGKSDNCATPKTPVSASRRSNPFKVDSSHKNDAINSTPKFNLLRDSVIDYQADQDIKDQISELASTPVKPQQFVGFETPSQKSGKSPLESDKPEESPLGSSKLDKSPFGSNKPDKSPFGSSKPIKSPFGSNSKTKTSGNLKQSSSIKGKCRSVGLGKKSTPNSSSDSSQRSLLSMFALQPKPKLECK